MALTDILLICATIIGPISAVQAQKWIEWYRERRNAKLHIFYWLMATRATPLAPDHVLSLNRIDLEFRGRSSKEKAVRAAWRLYADKLNEKIEEVEPHTSNWIAAKELLFTDLMFKMSELLSYDFDRVQIMRGAYYPRGHGDQEQRHRRILVGLEAVLYGHAALPMKITEVPTSEETTALQAALSETMLKAYGDDGALKVRILAEPTKRKTADNTKSTHHGK